MYLHLGQNTVVAEDEIIGIFDMDNTTSSKWTRQFLMKAEREGRLINVSGDIPKSFVVCCGKNGMVAYLSQLNTATLRQRAGTIFADLQ